MVRQVIRIDARAIVVASKLGIRADLKQVAVARHVLGQQQQMVTPSIDLTLVAGHRTSPLGDVCLNTQQWLDACALARTRELDRAVHGAMIGQRDSTLAQFGRAFGHGRHATETI